MEWCLAAICFHLKSTASNCSIRVTLNLKCLQSFKGEICWYCCCLVLPGCASVYLQCAFAAFSFFVLQLQLVSRLYVWHPALQIVLLLPCGAVLHSSWTDAWGAVHTCGMWTLSCYPKPALSCPAASQGSANTEGWHFCAAALYDDHKYLIIVRSVKTSLTITLTSGLLLFCILEQEQGLRIKGVKIFIGRRNWQMNSNNRSVCIFILIVHIVTSILSKIFVC